MVMLIVLHLAYQGVIRRGVIGFHYQWYLQMRVLHGGKSRPLLLEPVCRSSVQQTDLHIQRIYYIHQADRTGTGRSNRIL